ncbi:MAG: hypothetical protein VKL59_13340 [Nostocaceae cyanobacterium]|nr:hypothetical protein [Nostocaceae cyanobacterium]
MMKALPGLEQLPLLPRKVTLGDEMTHCLDKETCWGQVARRTKPRCSMMGITNRERQQVGEDVKVSGENWQRLK